MKKNLLIVMLVGLALGCDDSSEPLQPVSDSGAAEDSTLDAVEVLPDGFTATESLADAESDTEEPESEEISTEEPPWGPHLPAIQAGEPSQSPARRGLQSACLDHRQRRTVVCGLYRGNGIQFRFVDFWAVARRRRVSPSRGNGEGRMSPPFAPSPTATSSLCGPWSPTEWHPLTIRSGLCASHRREPRRATGRDSTGGKPLARRCGMRARGLRHHGIWPELEHPTWEHF